MSPSMGHTDTLTEIALEGRNGGYLLRFDPTRNEVSLHTAEHADGPGQRLALLTGATDEVRALAASRIPAGLTLPSVDLDRTWHLGDGSGGAVVTGTSADLGWWLTGRGSGEGLTSDTDELPEMEAW